MVVCYLRRSNHKEKCGIAVVRNHTTGSADTSDSRQRPAQYGAHHVRRQGVVFQEWAPLHVNIGAAGVQRVYKHHSTERLVNGCHACSRGMPRFGGLAHHETYAMSHHAKALFRSNVSVHEHTCPEATAKFPVKEHELMCSSVLLEPKLVKPNTPQYAW